MKQIDKKKRKDIVEGLTGVLSDSFVLYYKTHASHWNVEGPHFKSLHDLFMAQYTELWNALDLIAERIRALDSYAPVSMKDLIKGAALSENGQNRDAMQMVRDLADDNESLSGNLAKVIDLATSAGDQATADLLTERLGIHEKSAWMLRSILK
ncbi:MAG TPA: DNA starvation/stationary phase protection protein [Alphaproteobacteria bacterium]